MPSLQEKMLVSVLLAFFTSEAECEDRPQVPGGRSLNTAFCSYIGGKLDTEDTNVQQKQVRVFFRRKYSFLTTFSGDQSAAE